MDRSEDRYYCAVSLAEWSGSRQKRSTRAIIWRQNQLHRKSSGFITNYMLMITNVISWLYRLPATVTKGAELSVQGSGKVCFFFWYGRRGCEKFAPSNQPVKLLVGICKAPVCEDSPLARVASNRRNRLAGFRHWNHNQPVMTISRHLLQKYGFNGRTNAQLPNLVAEFTKPKSEQVPMW
jgi:hypothetical protein